MSRNRARSVVARVLTRAAQTAVYFIRTRTANPLRHPPRFLLAYGSIHPGGYHPMTMVRTRSVVLAPRKTGKARRTGFPPQAPSPALFYREARGFEVLPLFSSRSKAPTLDAGTPA